MRSQRRRLIHSALVATAVVVMTMLMCDSGVVLAKTADLTDTRGAAPKMSRSVEVGKVLSVLDQMVWDERLSDRTREKLSRLPREQVRLLASLADRILSAEQSSASDLAFLLMAALITFQ